MGKIMYYASYVVSNGVCPPYDYTYLSLRKARKSIRAIAAGECPAGGRASWRVCDRDGNVLKAGEIKG